MKLIFNLAAGSYFFAFTLFAIQRFLQHRKVSPKPPPDPAQNAGSKRLGLRKSPKIGDRKSLPITPMADPAKGGKAIFLKTQVFSRLADIMFKAGFIFNTVFLALRWLAAGRPPFAGMYEALILFAWAIGLVYSIFEFIYKIKIRAGVVSFLICFILMITAFLDSAIKPFPPALQSGWIGIHVLSYFIGYAGLSLSFIMGLIYLSSPESRIPKKDPAGSLPLDIIHRLIVFAFPFLTLGLTSGSVWANVAWGAYWSWDPKEACALITWLVYALYLHLYLLKGISGKKAACLSMAGFLVTLFTFLGVNFLFRGMHTYT